MGSLLLNKRFGLLLCAQGISVLGDYISFIAFPLLILRKTGSPLQTGIAFGIQFVPYALFSLVAGILVDRYDKRRVMYVTDFVRAVVTAVLPIASLFGYTAVWLVYCVILIVSTLSVFYNIAYQSIVPELVNREELAVANGRLQSAYSIGSLLGPALGGYLVSSWGPALAISIDALTFAFSGFLTLAIPATEKTSIAPATKEDMLMGIRHAVVFLWNNPLLRSSALILLGFNLLMAPYSVLIIMFGEHTLGLTGPTIGLIITSGGAGALGASLVADKIGRYLGVGRVTIISVLGAGLLSLLLSSSYTPLHMGLVWGVLSTIPVIINVNQLTLRQSLVPTALLGRVTSTFRLIAWSAIPVASGLAGFVSEWLGPRTSIFIVGIGLSILGLVSVRSPLYAKEQDNVRRENVS